MRLKPGSAAEYERRHANVWPEVVDLMRVSGISNYSIFRRDLDLFAYMEVDESILPSNERDQHLMRWWSTMKELMVFDGDKPQTLDMEEVFHLD